MTVFEKLRPAAASKSRPAEALTALERRVIEIARTDTLKTLEPPRERGRLSKIFLGPERVPPHLANEGLEAIRRLAVLAWHNRADPPARSIREALSAGLEREKIDAILTIIRRGIGDQNSLRQTPFRKIAR